MCVFILVLTWFDSPTPVFDMGGKYILEAFPSLLYTFYCVRETILTHNVHPESLFCMADDLLPLCWVQQILTFQSQLKFPMYLHITQRLHSAVTFKIYLECKLYTCFDIYLQHQGLITYDSIYFVLNHQSPITFQIYMILIPSMVIDNMLYLSQFPSVLIIL